MQNTEGMTGFVNILEGNCLDILPTLEPASVQCCVTSPPYWGLRDYGIDSQLGLESTPAEYIANMVRVFREVWRVLKDDGTLWVNCGSSYASGDKQPNRSRADALACGSDDKALRYSPSPDLSCLDLCDGCQAAIQNRRLHIVGNDQQTLQSERREHGTNRDIDRDFLFSQNVPDVVQQSTNHVSSQQPPVECCHCSNCGVCLSVLRSSSRDASLCARNSVYIGGTFQTGNPSAFRNQGNRSSSDALACSTITFPTFKAKDLVPIPWMLAMALQSDGWYLRSDIIWSKPNPMPESVTDRPTKSHEYIFLLTKRERYFYDACAIREENTPDMLYRASKGHTRGNGERDPSRCDATTLVGGVCEANGRNKRTVWTVATQPYSEAHFATFPEDLIKPCIMAGSLVGDTVLDPFAGSGTVGEVSLGLGRKSVLIELNPEYIDMIKIRTNVTIGML